MSESNSTLARPYAQAVFDLARQAGDYGRWSDQLGVLRALMADPTARGLTANPRIDRDRLAAIFIDVAGDRLDEPGRNLVRLMARNRRLTAVDEVATQFERLRAEAERVVEAELVTAVEVSDEQRDRIAAALGRKLGREIRLHTRINPDLIGGAVIRAGDWVVDGSVRARLKKLAGALTA
jgi:F-type H+-transporting ATPase subunit delta